MSVTGKSQLQPKFNSELQLQAACFQFCWNMRPATRYCIWAVPNGGTRNMMEGMAFKASGVLAGVHDLHFFWKARFYTFELKFGNNKMSDKQIKFKQIIEKNGGVCYLIESFEQFCIIFDEILNKND